MPAQGLKFPLTAKDETQAAFDAVMRRARALNAELMAQNRAYAAAQRGGEMAWKAQDSAARATSARMRNLSFQLVDVGQALATAPTMGIYSLQNLGYQVAQIGQLYAGQGGFTAAVKDSAAMVGRFALRMAPLGAAAGVAAAAFAGMTHEINQTSDVAVSMGDVMLASVLVIKDAVMDQLRPAIEAVSPWVGAAWDWVADKTIWLGNTIINAFRVVGSDIKFVFGNLPTIVEAATIGAANAVITSLNASIQAAASGIDWLTEKANSIPGVDIGKIGDLQAFDTIENPAITDLKKLGEAHKQVIQDIVASDPLGGYFEKVAEKAVELARATGMIATSVKDPWEGLRKVVGDTADKLQKRIANLGESLGGIFRGLMDNTLSWKDAAMQAVQAVLQHLNQVRLDQTGVGLFGDGLFGSVVSGLLGLRAGGGAVNPYGAYVVGEKGPELLQMGSRSGEVISNGKAFGARSSGASAVRIELGEGLEASILEKSADQSLEIVRSSAPATAAAGANMAMSKLARGEADEVMIARFGVKRAKTGVGG